MSHGCTAATMPFKINVWEGEPEYDPKSPEEVDNPTICPKSPKGFQEFFIAYEPVQVGREKTKEVRGWTIQPYRDIKPKASIYAHPITKGDLTVFYVNESEYCNVGYEDASFVSTSKKAITEFRKDFELGNFKIQTNVPVLHWS